MNTEVDLFSVYSTQISLEKGHWIDHRSVSSLSDGSPITFLSTDTEDYVDLSKAIIVPVKQVDVFLKEKQVTQATGTYSYRAYLETLLNCCPSAEQSQLTVALFYKDTAGKMEVSGHTKVVGDVNHGLNTRYGFSEESGTIEIVGPIFSDMFFSEHLLLSFVDLNVILNRNGNELCLMASENDVDYRVKLIDAYLMIRKVKVNPSISMDHEVALKKESAMYPILRVKGKSFIIPAGNPFLRKDNVFNGLNNLDFVTNSNIEAADLNSRGLHLNP
ncbi:uncharacterized transposon-derived [Paramuricea clavata]|uniref:Uncharacterized transposon-derived n=1 Tax=Paramuricea clavata TaxID=317549 RepID=A0A6S7G9A1_PARCT|nr:uncharacterized transposon-derived [Paramuricea clavata]